MTEKIKIEDKNLDSEEIIILPQIREILESHIVDIEPTETGNKELRKNMAGALYGIANVQIARTSPPLKIDSAEISPGKSVVLIGPNGSGKSTYLDGLMERGAHIETQSGKGAIVIGKPSHIRKKTRIARLDQEEMLGKIGNLPSGEVLNSVAKFFKSQFPVNWDNMDLYEQNLQNQEAQIRIETLMNQISDLFRINEFLKTNVRDLSGGEKTKLALFMALLSEADIYLFDEPTNHLDLKSISKLTALFNEYKKAGAGILSISHVDWFLEDAGNDGVFSIYWDKEERMLSSTQSSYKNFVKNSARPKNPIISGDIQWPQKDYGYKQGSLLVESPLKFTVPNSPLKNISMPNFYGGELIIMSGDNGTGKTKLLETVVQNSKENMPKKIKGTQIAYLPQFWPEEISYATIEVFFNWIKENASPHSSGSSYHKDQPPQKFFINLINQLKFGGTSRTGDSYLNKPLSKLSGGEQRILWFIAVSALRDIDMLVLDEPTNHMDKFLQEKIAEAIKNFKGAILLSTHDKNLTATLTKDGGNVQGKTRKPEHLVLNKNAGITIIKKSSENPITYAEKIMTEAKQEVKKIKF